jgi:3-hydroxyethyl bacteriochlorophyllide a dehydrogenase
MQAGPASGQMVGRRVFIPGSRGFRDVRGLFGGAAGRLVTPGARVIPVDESLGDKAILLALAATAYHAIVDHPPELIVGHGVLGRLLARITIAMGHPAPNVWELSAERADGAAGYSVLTPENDPRRDYLRICDASGDSNILDQLVSRLRAGGEITLAGFYDRLSFAFAPAFMREVTMRIAAEWQAQDMASLNALIAEGKLSLDHLITHRQAASDAPDAYRTAFGDASCLKMVLDWRKQG